MGLLTLDHVSIDMVEVCIRAVISPVKSDRGVAVDTMVGLRGRVREKGAFRRFLCKRAHHMSCKAYKDT